MSDLAGRTTTSAVTSRQCLKGTHGLDTLRGETMAVSNGTTNFGKVSSGTPMGKVTSTGKVRPCGKTQPNADQATVTTLNVNEAENFYIGDKVEIINMATGAVRGNKTLTGVDKTSSPNTLTWVGAVTPIKAIDVVQLDSAEAGFAGAEDTLGVLLSDVNTFNKDIGLEGTHMDVGCGILWHGQVYAAVCDLGGSNSLTEADTPALSYE